MKPQKHLTAVLTAALAVCLALTALTPSLALFGWGDKTPALSAFTKTAPAGAAITFREADFTGRVTGGDALDAIIVSALPTNGVLELEGRALALGEMVPVAGLSALHYQPAAEALDVSDTFDCLPIFAKTGAGSAATVSVSLSDSPNSTPIARDLSFETYAGVKLCAPLRYSDLDGDAVTFQLVSEPRKGTVEVKESAFVYTPAGGKSGKDSFTYTATDSRSNVSAMATVSLNILKRAAKETFHYTDMKESPAHHAALALREAGILVGETMGADSFFYPDKPVTRAQFVALTAAVTELAVPTMAVGTGLSDNEAIPTWARPYVAAAVHSGIVSGQATETGNKVFRPDDPITRAEAASIIARCLALASDVREPAFPDIANVPVWARSALQTATAAGIVPVFADNTVRAGAAVTREDCAQMVFEMLRHVEENRSRGGLLGLFN